MEVSPELAGVGFIIGPKIAGYLFGGGLLSYFVLIPAIKLFGDGLTAPIFPGTVPIGEMGPAQIRGNYVFYIGAGAVTAAGLISLARSLPTIWSALRAGFGDIGGAGGAAATLRTARDLPMRVVLVGVAALVAVTAFVPPLGIGLVGAVLALAFAFLFVTVSSRITGQIGSSANPISGMTVATVLLTALIFLAVGWVGVEHRVLALSIGGVVCIAAAVAGATSQDLKTGYLVGATPARQQIGLIAGATTSAILIGFIITFLNDAKTTLVARDFPGTRVDVVESGRVWVKDGRIVQRLADGEMAADLDGAPACPATGLARGCSAVFAVGRLYEARDGATAGRYLLDPTTRTVRYAIDPGIGGREPVDALGAKVDKLDSPKSQIMALVVDGILTQKLPWGLILIGVFLAIAMEIIGVASLPVAVGVYLPISTSAAMFAGGALRWLVDRRMGRGAEDEGGDSGPGVLFSSGLIAGGAITGIVLAALTVLGVGSAYDLSHAVGALGEAPLLAFGVFVLAVLVPLYRMGTKRES